jgi:predicted metal-dependent hydrolase
MSLLRSLFSILKPQATPRAPRKERLSHAGQYYDLKKIYDQINEEYFEKKISLSITWSGSSDRTARTRRLLGSYHQKKRLIKIHRLLDNNIFPEYFLSYVVYHEMLHHAYPPKQRGKQRIHHATFKEREKDFREYSAAKEWEKENKKLFFKGT